MGKFRSKLKGQPKGKRWAKGQSSSSNPDTRKYRDAAKSKFFQPSTGPSNLTADALRQHDITNTFMSKKIEEPPQMDIEDNDTVSESSTYRSFQTFASDWTECSNVSFSKLLNVFRPDSALHKEMLAILAAITEVIKQNGGQETSTEYFAALITTLEATETEMSLCAILSLLNMGIKTVPKNVLKLQFSTLSKKFVDLLSKNCESDNNVVLKSLINLISHVLRVQELATWSSQSTMQVYNSILAFALHTKPKIRKAAQNGIISILKASDFMEAEGAPSHHPAAQFTGQFILQNIENCLSNSRQTSMLHTLTLLKDVIHTFPNKQIKACCEEILKIMTLNQPIVTSCCMQVFHGLFSTPKASVPATLNGQLISALYEYQPSPTDVQPTLAWILVMQQAHVHLSDVDINVSGSTLPKIIQTLTQLWLSERSEIMGGVTRALQVIFEDCVGPICATNDVANQNLTILEKIFGIVTNCLSYQYNKAWHQVLHVIATMFKVSGKNCSNLLVKTLVTLAELRDSYKFSYNNELEFAVGHAVKYLGPEIVLEHISLKKNDNEINMDRTWLLPILKEKIEYSTLSYYKNNILPMALLCKQKSQFLLENHNGALAHSHELLYFQLWNLLPSFCNHPTDVVENFKSLAKILGSALNEVKDLRLSIMASLRKLITTAQNDENDQEIAELGRFAKNYLPILFNIYTTKVTGTDDEGRRLAALDTIKVYLTITPAELQNQLFLNALEQLKKLQESQEDQFVKESIFDLLRAMVKYQPQENVKLLFDNCVVNLSSVKNAKHQKKAYKILEEICQSETPGCQNFLTQNRKNIQKLLKSSLTTSAVTSKGSRLRCLNFLIKSEPNLDHESTLIRSTLPEAILGTKDINEKCRLAAFATLNTIFEILSSKNQINEFLNFCVAGLTGNTELICCTILGLSSIVFNFSGVLGTVNLNLLLETICKLQSSSTREIVQASLGFIKVYVRALPNPLVASSIPVIVKGICSMTDDCKRHFRIKVRDLLDRLVRKYGCDSIIPHVPQKDEIMMKRLRNLRKLNSRKKKNKEKLQKDQGSDSDADFTVKAKPKSVEEILADSDSELDSDYEQSSNKKQSKQVKTWIQEDFDKIVDFTDPSAVSQIVTTQPNQSKNNQNAVKEPSLNKNRGFKTSTDGRLIIADDDDDSSDDDKGKINFDSDSENSDVDDNVTAILKDKKRKRDTESVRSGASGPAMKYRAGGTGIHRPVKASNEFGSEYKAKKARGDQKKKGKVDPYAYLPLKRTALNKRKKMKNSGQFKNIVRAAKKGAKIGSKIKKTK